MFPENQIVKVSQLSPGDFFVWEGDYASKYLPKKLYNPKLVLQVGKEKIELLIRLSSGEKQKTATVRIDSIHAAIIISAEKFDTGF